LLGADGLGTNAIMRRTGKSKTCVWRWQERFMHEGVDGLLRDKTRPSRVPPLGPEVVKRVVALTQGDPPGETTHWTAAKLAKRRLKRGVFRSVVDLQAAINRFLGETSHDLKPFTWTADPDKIIAAVRRGRQVLDSIH
jgi:transposase